MPNELELCAVSAVIGAMLGAGIAYAVTHKIDGAQLAHEQAAHADDIARINATAAQQLAQALARQQAAEGRIATIEQQYNTEVAQHAKDALDYRAKLLAGTERVRVKLSGSCHASTDAKGTPAASGSNDTVTYGYLSPTIAASVFSVADDADQTADKLRALQAYVRELQVQGYISGDSQ